MGQTLFKMLRKPKCFNNFWKMQRVNVDKIPTDATVFFDIPMVREPSHVGKSVEKLYQV